MRFMRDPCVLERNSMKRFLPIIVSVILSTLSGVTWAAGGRLPEVGADQLSFRYRSADGEFELDCKHYDQGEGRQDYRVLCGPGTPNERTYIAHVVIREYRRQIQPRLAYEILYFVTDRQMPLSRAFTSNTQWLEFSDDSALHRILMGQSVENDYAFLQLEYRPGQNRGATGATQGR